MSIKVYLDSEFRPVPPADAVLVKVISDDGRVAFYHPSQAAAKPDDAGKDGVVTPREQGESRAGSVKRGDS